jgi:tetratricopeptide (TPR) repeat protein
VFALAAIPARYALERGDWAAAAALVPRPSKFPYADALTYFARAIGAARTGNAAAVRESITALQGIHQQLTQAKETYWATQTAIQQRSASAWLALAEQREADALGEMRAAAAAEDATEKSAVTPGPLVPARELLAEMLLELKQPAEARKEFEAALKREPNRFRSVDGAARAASEMGDRAAAGRYYAQLLQIGERADKPGRPDLVTARTARRSR